MSGEADPYLSGMADGLDAAARLTESLIDHYSDSGTRAALGLTMDMLREQSARWRTKAAGGQAE